MSETLVCDGANWIAQIGLTGPSGCADIGDLCADGTVFAGWDPILHERLFIPTTDQELPGSPGTYKMAWKNAADTDDISAGSDSDGRVNHANRGGDIEDFPAFQACEDLVFGGHDDWYLPAKIELYYLWSVRDELEASGNITDFAVEMYWSSTEEFDMAWYQYYERGMELHYWVEKNYPELHVRCVRR